MSEAKQGLIKEANIKTKIHQKKENERIQND
jgi:hypothetical protein